MRTLFCQAPTTDGIRLQIASFFADGVVGRGKYGTIFGESVWAPVIPDLLLLMRHESCVNLIARPRGKIQRKAKVMYVSSFIFLLLLSSGPRLNVIFSHTYKTSI